MNTVKRSVRCGNTTDCPPPRALAQFLARYGRGRPELDDAAANQLIKIAFGATSLAFAASTFVSYTGASFSRSFVIWLYVFVGVMFLSWP